MASAFYTISINQIAGTANSAGFVDSNSVTFYMANGNTPSTNVKSMDKKRANIRYTYVLNQLESMSNMYVSNIVATGANADTAPSNFTFTAEFENGASTLVTNDESNAGQFLTGTAAIKRCVARALTIPTRDVNAEIIGVEKTTAPANGGTANAAVRDGNMQRILTVGQLTNSIATAEAAVTVTAL